MYGASVLEKVSSYLNHKKLQIPDREKMSEILGIPLMLILYTRVRSVMCQGMDKDPCGSWREDLSSEGNLLWNYIQCQVFAAKKILTEKGMLGKQGYRNVDFAAASEYIAPYLAARMNQRGEYEAAFTDVERWINEGCELLQQVKGMRIAESLLLIKRKRRKMSAFCHLQISS